MSIASGFSIQRNDIIQVPHRQQYESHDAVSGLRVYLLKSLPDYEDKSWNWDIRMGEVRMHLDRGPNALGVNLNNATATGVGAGGAWATEREAWQANAYTEGSTAAGYGSIEYNSGYGMYGAIIFDTSVEPVTGEKIEISYIEHTTKFTGDGGLLFQLAHDMCIHPYNSPEIFQNRFGNFTSVTDDNHADINGTIGQEYKSNIPQARNAGGNDIDIIDPLNGGAAGSLVNIFKNDLSIDYLDIFDGDGFEAKQRTVKTLWKIVKEHKEIATLNWSGSAGVDNNTIFNGDSEYDISLTYSIAQLLANGGVANYIPLMTDFPLIESDLGGGTFKVAIDGKVLDRDDWVVICDTPTRTSRFMLKRTAPMSWIANTSSVSVEIAYIWKKSIDVPFGALVGRSGLGPNQIQSTNTSAMLGFPHDDQAVTSVDTATNASNKKYWVFSRAFRSELKDSDDITLPKRAYFGWHTATASSSPQIVLAQGDVGDSANTNGVVGLGGTRTGTWPLGGSLPIRHQNITKIGPDDLMYLEMESSGEYQRAFNLIYPSPLTTGTSTSDSDVKSKLREITDRFVVESEKGVDLLSDSNLSFVASNSPASNRKPQKWRIRFVWDDTTLSLKVNVGTEYQIKDDCTVTEVQGRDGVKSAVFREPGELCDVYNTPEIGRGASLSVNRAKSQWFRKTHLEKDIARSYPMSYKMTVTDHGMALFVFDQAAVDQDDDYAWFVIQRHVDQTTGEPEFSDKSPVHCVYSPTKRPVDVASLTPYYATADLADMSKPNSVYSSLAGVFKTEAPTIFVNRSAGFFNGAVNAIDFNGYGYASGTDAGAVSSTTLAASDIKSDLFRGMTGTQSNQSTNVWWEKTYSFYIKRDADTDAKAHYIHDDQGTQEFPPKLVVGHYIACKNKAGEDVDTDPYIWGGRIKSYQQSNGLVTISSVQNITSDVISNDAVSATSLITLITADDGTYAKDVNLYVGTSRTGDVTSNFVPFAGTAAAATRTDEYKRTFVQLQTVPTLNISGKASSITDLAVTGFNSLPRRRDTSIVLDATPAPGGIEQVKATATEAALIRAITTTGDNLLPETPAQATWVSTNDTAASFSENTIWPRNILERMSTYKDASADGTGVPTSVENITLSDYKSGDSALMDILYTSQPENVSKIFESMVVALDDVEITRSEDAYILTYDEWTRRGDPNTVPKFLESLEAAGVTNLGLEFKIPNEDASTVPNFNEVVPGMDPSGSVGVISNTTQNFSTGKKFFSEWDTNTTGAFTFDHSTDPTGGIGGAAWVAGVDYPTWTITTGMLVASTKDSRLTGKMPGDVIWPESYARNQYMYDFWNESLYFKTPPRTGSTFSISMINYQTSNPSQGTYIISRPEDRNFPETNLNEVKSINRFIVREKDVLKPWDYHVSATMHEIDSHAIINPQEQLSITQGRNFVFSFPTQLTTQRFYYPESELDLICVSSADFSTQAGYVEINKYTDSNGVTDGVGGFTATQTAMKNAFAIVGHETNTDSADGTALSDIAIGAYGGHTGPDADMYVWRKNKRKYEGMPSTLPNGNGMRIFMQVTGSSIRHSDVEPGDTPPPSVG